MEAKLEEYLQWGMRLMETHAGHLRRIAPGQLLTEHPLREKSLDALVRATLAWAYTHTDDPDFLRRSPSEVALYLLASRSALATAIELGKKAPPHLDYTPPEDAYTPEEVVLELALGLTPLVGEVTDATGSATPSASSIYWACWCPSPTASCCWRAGKQRWSAWRSSPVGAWTRCRCSPASPPT